MSGNLKLIAFVLFTLLFTVCQAEDKATEVKAAEVKTVRVFCLGNSFSQGAIVYLRNIVKAAGQKIVIGEAAYPGCSLKQHWTSIDAAEKDPTSKTGMPFGKTTKERMGTEKWDIVTIQQASIDSHNIKTYNPYAKQIVEWMKTAAPGAEIVVHQTWAYRADDPRFVDGKYSRKKMYAELTSSYHTVADEMGLRVMPVGDAFNMADSDPKWGWKPTPDFDAKTAVAPTLPDQKHSLHAGYKWIKNAKDESKLFYDGHHSNINGSYLAGCVWFESLFNISVVGNSYHPAEISAEDAAYLQNIAHEAVAAERKRVVKPAAAPVTAEPK